MAEIVLEKVTKVYGDGTVAVRKLDLEIPDGGFTVLVGPSGCGKTTALRMIAGLEEITSGVIRLGGRVINDVQPKDRDLAMVFQNYALYPHMSVYDNIAFGLRLRRLPASEIRPRVEAAASTLGLSDQLRKKPRQLSGGQRQRVAMGRAIVRNPAAFLMDEPLSNLDAKLRVQMRVEISRIQRELGITTVYVTHDQTEAMTMGDQVVVMRDGVVQQVGTPNEIYGSPDNLFAAGFIGSPAMNLVPATLEAADGRTYASFAGFRLELDERHPSAEALRPLVGGKPVVVGIRPEDVEDAEFASGAPAGSRITAVPEVCEAVGPEMYLHFRLGVEPLVTDETRSLVEDGVAELEETMPGGGMPFVARVNRRTAAREGEPIELALDVSALHFFDPQSGAAIR
jgi:multiple sugar transport system ATP-binding protein